MCINMHTKWGVCDDCQRSEEVLSELQCYMLKLTMFIRGKWQDSYWINPTANYPCVCAGVRARSTTVKDSQSRGVFLWYGSLLKPLAAAPFSESAVKWLVFYWWAPEVASVGNWIFDLLEFGKYILSVWSSPGKTPPSYQQHYDAHTHRRTHARRQTDVSFWRDIPPLLQNTYLFWMFSLRVYTVITDVH